MNKTLAVHDPNRVLALLAFEGIILYEGSMARWIDMIIRGGPYGSCTIDLNKGLQKEQNMIILNVMIPCTIDCPSCKNVKSPTIVLSTCLAVCYMYM